VFCDDNAAESGPGHEFTSDNYGGDSWQGTHAGGNSNFHRAHTCSDEPTFAVLLGHNGVGTMNQTFQLGDIQVDGPSLAAV
jgi:hypothetical protein